MVVGVEAPGIVEPPSLVAKPDEAHYESLIKVETDAIENIRGKIATLQEKIASQSGGREEYIRQRDAIRQKINTLTTEIDALENERKAQQDKVVNAQTAGRNLRNQLDALQRNMRFQTVEEIDQRIQKIEYDMMTSSLSLKEEKALQAEIDKLRKAKPELAKVAELESQAQYVENAGSDGSMYRMNELRDELRKLRDQRRDEQDRLRDLNASREAAMAPLQGYYEERESLRRKLATHESAVSQLRSELRGKELEYRAYQARLNQSRTELARYERQRAQIVSDREALMKDLAAVQGTPFDWKATLASQMMSYLSDLVTEYQKTTEGNEQDDQSNLSNEPIATEDGTFSLYTRVREEAFTIGDGKKKKKKKQTQKPAAAPSNKLQHQMATIKDFISLGIDPIPQTIEECPAVIKKCEAILEAQRAKQSTMDEVVERKRQVLQERIAAIDKKEQELIAKAPPGWKEKKPTEKKENKAMDGP